MSFHFSKHTINIRNLETKVFLGVSQPERDDLQLVYIDLHLDYQAQLAVRNDCIDDAIDYDGLVKKVVYLAQSQAWCLLESMSHALVHLIFDDYPSAFFVSVKIHKPLALKDIADVCVSFESAREPDCV